MEPLIRARNSALLGMSLQLLPLPRPLSLFLLDAASVVFWANAVTNCGFALARYAAKRLTVSVRSLTFAQLDAVVDGKLAINFVIYLSCVALLAYLVGSPIVAFSHNS